MNVERLGKRHQEDIANRRDPDQSQQPFSVNVFHRGAAPVRLVKNYNSLTSLQDHSES